MRQWYCLGVYRSADHAVLEGSYIGSYPPHAVLGITTNFVYMEKTGYETRLPYRTSSFCSIESSEGAFKMYI